MKTFILILLCLLVSSCNNEESIVQPENKSLILIYPKGGEYFSPNDSIPIIWETNLDEPITIEFSSDNRLSWTLIDSVFDKSQILVWKIPQLISNVCFLKITANSLSDSMDNPFSINLPNYQINKLEYYPLSIGNQWVYKSTYSYSEETYHYSTIIGDTIINQKIYFIVKNNIYDLYYYDYETIDTLTGNILRFEVNQERIIDNLYAKVGDKIACLRYNGSLDSTLFESEENIDIWGSSRNMRTYFNDGFPDRWRYSLANGIGLFAYKEHQHPLGIASDTLKACIVNGIIYGDTTLIR